MKMPDYIISDSHFFHKNIVEYAGRPLDHNELMVKQWLDTVREGDTVLHLGDVLMGPVLLWITLPNLPGDVSVLVGNHDEPFKRAWIETHWPNWKFREHGFKLLYRDHMIYFTHEPLDPLGMGKTDINVHGHIHEQPAPTRQHINVCVEWLDYTPQPLRPLLDAKIDELDAA